MLIIRHSSQETNVFCYLKIELQLIRTTLYKVRYLIFLFCLLVAKALFVTIILLLFTMSAISFRSDSVEVDGCFQSWSLDFDIIFSSEIYNDVSFIIDDQEFKAHKLILSARSPVFADMFRSEKMETSTNHIRILDVTPADFYQLLRFIYTNKVQVTDENCRSLLIAANKYLIPSLKSICEEFIIKTLTPGNCVEMLTLADLHNAEKLKNMATGFIRSRLYEVCIAEGLKSLKKSHPDAVFDVMEDAFF